MSRNAIAAWRDALDGAVERAYDAVEDENPRRNPERRLEAAYLQQAIARAGITIARDPDTFEPMREELQRRAEACRAQILAFLESGR